jgi:FAD dependent oxidoreductase TIGR03364
MTVGRPKFERVSLGSNSRKRVAVVGAGIVGLAHAWSAAKRGHEVLLLERDSAARGASVRNFGMVWPIGQPNGPLHLAALRSRRLWTELLSETGYWHDACGSLHLAFRSDELNVLEEFVRLSGTLGYECELLSPDEVQARSPAVRRQNLLAGLWSPTEMCVDPRQVIGEMPAWLEERYGVQMLRGVAVQGVALPWVVASNGDRWRVDQVIVATGADFRTLFPEVFQQAGFRICKLQMMRTHPQPDNWRLGTMLASGLTLRHYETFRVCDSLVPLRRRIAEESPNLDRFGIHVMAAQNGRGEVILGDSHEYDDDVTPFDKSLIDRLILDELRKIMDLPDWTICQRWHGVYPKLPNTLQFIAEPEPEVHIVIASGGCGMTMSFGLAEDLWNSWEGGRSSADSDGAVQPAAVVHAGVSVR